MKMIKAKTHALEGGLQWCFNETDSTFLIRATVNGIRLDGRSNFISNMEELQEFAKNIADAWAKHEELKGVLRKELSGNP